MNEFIAQINAAGQAYMVADIQVAECHRLGRMGRSVREALTAQEQAQTELVAAFRACGHTLDELERLQDEAGRAMLAYGVAEVLKRLV
jgi:hypothetical protein